MYAEGGFIMVLAVFLSLGFIGGLVWYVNKHLGDVFKTKEWLTKFVSLLLTALVALFIVDKVVSFKIQLLSDEMS